PVLFIRGRIHAVVASIDGIRPTQRQSETTTCVAPIAGLRANASGTESLTPPSVSSSISFPQRIETAGKSRGIDALARTGAWRLRPQTDPVYEKCGRRFRRSWQTIPKH